MPIRSENDTRKNAETELEMERRRDAILSHRRCKTCHGRGKTGKPFDYRDCTECRGSGDPAVAPEEPVPEQAEPAKKTVDWRPPPRIKTGPYSGVSRRIS